MGPHIDGLKLAGGSFSLFPEAPLRQLIDLAHTHGVYVSTGGWMEHVLAGSGGDIGGAVDKLPGQVPGAGLRRRRAEHGVPEPAGGRLGAARGARAAGWADAEARIGHPVWRGRRHVGG